MESTLHQQISAMKQSLLDEGFVDGHFVELELLEDGDNLHFTEEIITLFFTDSARLIVDVEKELNNDPIDYSKVDKILHQFKGSSSSVGANRVRLQGTKLRESCKDGDVEGWKAALKQLKKEHATLKEKLDTYFQLVKQLGSEKKTMWHPNEGQVDMLAKNQLMKMAITKDEKVEFGHKEDRVKKGTGKEPGKVVTEEEAVKVVSDEESVQMVAK
ncbi:hypothetical protein AAG906_009447 [Vitis piasezkii]